MCKLNKKSGLNRIDDCLREAISTLTAFGFQTISSCCGHGKHPLTIVYMGKSGGFFDLFSGVQIPRKKRFYQKDNEGYYFIPEVNHNEPR